MSVEPMRAKLKASAGHIRPADRTLNMPGLTYCAAYDVITCNICRVFASLVLYPHFLRHLQYYHNRRCRLNSEFESFEFIVRSFIAVKGPSVVF